MKMVKTLISSRNLAKSFSENEEIANHQQCFIFQFKDYARFKLKTFVYGGDNLS